MAYLRSWDTLYTYMYLLKIYTRKTQSASISTLVSDCESHRKLIQNCYQVLCRRGETNLFCAAQQQGKPRVPFYAFKKIR